MITIHHHGASGCGTSERLEDVPALLAAGAQVWIDAEGDGDGIAQFLGETLKLHPLAVEDILQERQRPKIEDYGDYLYIVIHGIVREQEADSERLDTVELDLVLTPQWLFTHHRLPSLAVQAAKEELQRNTRALERGPGFVAHSILDHVVDYYLPVVDAFDEDIDELEHALVDRPSPKVLQRIFKLKRSLQRLRRIAVHQRDVLQRLSRGEFDEIPEKALPFYRDVYDHFIRVADLADSYREQLSGALDAYLSVVSNRMNEVMKTLTIVATLMLPITFIAGVYGMNFEHMPELHWRYGYLFALGLMALVSLGMLLWFRHKKWL
ncbi:MAG: magnesium/cobalt transporter CorA [Myxococcales bacterium]|nr:magnesium/cobalt transporter CorA [Myxococcales bacterium]